MYDKGAKGHLARLDKILQIPLDKIGTGIAVFKALWHTEPADSILLCLHSVFDSQS